MLIVLGQNSEPVATFSGGAKSKVQESDKGSEFAEELDRALVSDSRASDETGESRVSVEDLGKNNANGSPVEKSPDRQTDLSDKIKSEKDLRDRSSKAPQDVLSTRLASTKKGIDPNGAMARSEAPLPPGGEPGSTKVRLRDGLAEPAEQLPNTTDTSRPAVVFGADEAAGVPAVSAFSRQSETIDKPGGMPKKSARIGHDRMSGMIGKQKDIPDSAIQPARTSGKKFLGNPAGKNLSAGGRERRSGKSIVDIRDYRLRATRGLVDPASVVKNTGEVEMRLADADQENGTRLVRFGVERAANPQPSSATTPGRTESPFAAYVREHMNGQIVKQTGIILRNNNHGEIRLVLKPEHLGRVRMRIQLDENRLSGRIIVESSFVKESFEQNLEELYRVFRNNGYETGAFEVLVDGGNEGNGAGQKRKDGFSAKTLKQLDDAVPILEEIDHQSELINLVI